MVFLRASLHLGLNQSGIVLMLSSRISRRANLILDYFPLVVFYEEEQIRQNKCLSVIS